MTTDTRIPCHRPHGPEHEGMPPAGSVCGACGGDVDAPATVPVVDTRPEADGTPTGLHGPRPDDDAGVPFETARAAWELDADDQADHETDDELYEGPHGGPARGRDWGPVVDRLYPNLSTDAARREADEAAAGPWHWECRRPDWSCTGRGVADVAPNACPFCGATDLVVKPVPPPPVLDAHQAEGSAAAAAYWAGPTTQPEAWTDALRPPGGDEGGTPMAPAEVILRHLVVDAIGRYPRRPSLHHVLERHPDLAPSVELFPWLQLPEALAVYLDGLVREHATPDEQVGQ